MSNRSCPRLFEVAAARDGRLVGTELVSFQRHLGACPHCALEAQALDALAEASRALGGGERDELHVRRERTRLLASFDRDLVAPQRRVAPWRWVAPLVALCGALFLFWQVRSVSAPAPTPPSIATVSAGSRAVWVQRRRGNVDEVQLDQGALSIHVDHTLEPTRRFVVLLPDGELEDIGTTFRVSADGQHTTQVTVQDGSVLLRLRGVPPVLLGPGQAWSRDLSAASSPPLALPTPSEKIALPTLESTPRRLASHPPRASAEPPPSAPPVAADSSLDFRAALALLNAGTPRQAAAAFEQFAIRHPEDPRAEDAAYLRVLALYQSGDRPSTQRAAQRYLERYPAGFRRAEVERLSR